MSGKCTNHVGAICANMVTKKSGKNRVHPASAIIRISGKGRKQMIDKILEWAVEITVGFFLGFGFVAFCMIMLFCL